MRLGLSPTRKQLTDYRPARVTVCVLVHIPEQIGYFAHRFNVLKLCLQSIVKNTNTAHDLLVFDNGSCPEIVDYLRSLLDQRIVRYLILSGRNIGKINALNIMFRTAPGEVIAYSDDDILFFPGWLERQVQILDIFPKVGMVSGVAVRQQFRYGNQYLQPYLTEFPDVSIEIGHFIPDDWERAFFASVGQNPDRLLEETRRTYKEIVLRYKGTKVYSTATHFQFVTFKSVILQALNTKQWDKRLMGGLGPPSEEGRPTTDLSEPGLDERIDRMGYARLSTFEKYVAHIGNVVTPEFANVVSDLGLANEMKYWTPPNPFLLKAFRLRIIRRILGRFHNWTYFLLRYRPAK